MKKKGTKSINHQEMRTWKRHDLNEMAFCGGQAS